MAFPFRQAGWLGWVSFFLFFFFFPLAGGRFRVDRVSQVATYAARGLVHEVKLCKLGVRFRILRMHETLLWPYRLHGSGALEEWPG